MKKLLQSLFILLFVAGAAMAQERTITGTVTDQEDGKPLPGVTVRIAGAKGGTQTGGDGKYTLRVPSSANTLEFSYLGYVSQNKSISGSVVNVLLAVDAKSLTEVVVTGVGVATDKRKTAIAIETVSAKEMLAVPSASIDKALIGKVAGAQISSSSGQPGQQAAIMLRGINTMQTTQPMILVDGVQVNAGNSVNGSSSNFSSRLADLDLSNVDRVEVIQGSAAATLYGAQGANGVIQIFTKKGLRNGETRITVNSRVNIDNMLKGKFGIAKNHYFETDAEGYIVDGDGVRISRDAQGFWGAPQAPALSGTLTNDKPYKETTFDHIDQLFKSNVPTFNNTVNVSGGAEKFDYAINASNIKQKSILNGDLTRTNLSLNVGAELAKNLTLRSTTQLIYSDNSTGGITGANNVYSALASGLTSRSYWDLTFRDDLGNYVSNPEGDNSVNPFYTYQFRDNTSKNVRIVQGIDLNYKFPKFVEINYKYGIDNYRNDFQDDILYQLKNNLYGTSQIGLDPYNGRITFDRDKETLQNSLLSVYFKTNFEEDFNSSLPISTSTQLSYDYRHRKYQNTLMEGTGFPSYPPFTIGQANSKTFETTDEEFITYGYLINQRVDYGSLFGFSGGVRVDYSSEFGAGSKAFVFPRGDAYVRFDDLIKSPKLYELKLRGAYGEAGVQPNTYDRRVTLENGNIGNGSYLSPRAESRNADLRVQRSREAEVGIDAGLMLGKNQWFERLKLNATYWDRKSTDVIEVLDVAPSSGSSSIKDNLLDLRSNGFQFSIDADVYTSDNFSWQFGTRFGASKSIIDRISGGKDVSIGSGGSGQFVLREGESVGAFFGKAPLTSVDQLDPSGARYIPEANVGNFVIVNGMVVNQATKQVQFTSNQVPIGDPNPKFNVSFTNAFTIHKNLSVSFQLDWTQGNKIYNQTKQWLYRDLIHEDVDKAVTVGNETGAFINYYTSLYNTNTTNGYFVEDGSFVRLRDVTVSYNFNSLIKKNFLKNATLSVSGRNLFTITDYTGFDPEAAANLNDPKRRGLDLYAFPNFRSFQVALSLGF
ncbi:putative outer membrane protein [Pedobacter sp. BAL39]|uniref:SusC/RagA family TonB-linked outer membrane protein n=1 Tax=Pedobacter sp. BAL39 TaxID=391596 RepID=UPI000155A4AD|nr:SusC/RagA family TonB-linked outer membrane protein [Pedobacter sp. BAL39]EDM34503.1 putative outer membrane protein [Pedobacter sp. BAL39]